jgi:hypothetical protein
MTRSAFHKDQEDNAYTRAWDKALEEMPPEIIWRKNNKGILVAVSVNDPHEEQVPSATHCRNGHEYTENSWRASTGRRLCYECSRAVKRASYYRRKNVTPEPEVEDESPLLKAARTGP